MQIQVNVNNLSLIKADELNENEYNIHNIQFTFSEEYEGLSKVALFTAENTYKVIIVNNECSIPPEVLTNNGCFTLGVYAFEVNGDELIERYSPSPINLYVQTGSYISDEDIENSEPLTPTDKEQILAMIEQLEIDAQQVEANTQDIANIKQEQITQNEGIQSNANEIERVAGSIPTKTSDLINDNGFIDNSVNNLINYTLTTQTGSKIDLEINSSNYQLTAKLYDKNNNLISTSNVIDLPIESMVVNATYSNGIITLTLQNGNTLSVDISDIVSGLVKPEDLADYVKNTDYATTSKGGVIKTASGTTGAGTYVSGTGVLLANNLTYANYGSAGGNTFISKGTLENVITGKELVNKTYVDGLVGDIESILHTLNTGSGV